MAQAFRLKEKADRASERKSVEERDKEYYAEDSVNWDKPVLDYDTLNRQPWVAYGEIDEGAHILFAFVQLGNRAISFGRVISFGIRVPNDNAHAELINKLRSHMGDQQNVRQIQVDTLANIISMAGVATVGIKDRHNSLMDIIEVG